MGIKIVYPEDLGLCEECSLRVENYSFVQLGDHQGEVAALTKQLNSVQPHALKEKLRSAEARIAELESRLKNAELNAARFNWCKRFLPSDGWTLEMIDRNMAVDAAVDAAVAKLVPEQDE